MRLASILGIRGARDKPRNSYAGSALSFLFGRSTSGKPVNERVADHPLYSILHDESNEEMTSFVFRETLMSKILKKQKLKARCLY